MPIRRMNEAQTQLPYNFQPSLSDVICGKGRVCYTHFGNQTFRTLVELNLPRYSSASRIDKSTVVIEIAHFIRNNAINGGGFVKLDPSKGLWFEVGEAASREKVAQTLREMALKNDPAKEAQKQKMRAASRAQRLAAKRKADIAAVYDLGSTMVAPSMVTSPDDILSTIPPTLVNQSSNDWFDDGGLSDNSAGDPGDLDESFFDHYNLSCIPAQQQSSCRMLKPSTTPSLLHQNVVEDSSTSTPPPPSLVYQSSRDWFPMSDMVSVDPRDFDDEIFDDFPPGNCDVPSSFPRTVTA
jgi:hypothetical protein